MRRLVDELLDRPTGCRNSLVWRCAPQLLVYAIERLEQNMRMLFCDAVLQAFVAGTATLLTTPGCEVACAVQVSNDDHFI